MSANDAPPSGQAPPRLDYSDGEELDALEPRIAQTFLVGDGKGRSYSVPPKATRLFLGFADGFYYKGDPGWYDNNGGTLDVSVDVASE